MAKLTIYRGDVFEQEVELGERAARIGRGADNEIVLADPMRSVSRHHAEVRFEQGAYALVDSRSQNGLWVAGQRVPRVVLEPGVPVVMGSYKLVLKDERPPVSPTDATVIMRVLPDQSADATLLRPSPFAAPPVDANATVIRPVAKPPLPPPVKTEAPKPAVPAEPKPEAPKPEAKSEPKPEPKPAPPPPAPEPPKAAPKPAPPPPPRPAPPPPPPAPAPAAAAPSPVVKPKPAGARRSQAIVVFGGLAAVLLVGAGAAVFLTPLGRFIGLSGDKPSEPTPAPPVAAAQPAPPPPVKTPAPKPRRATPAPPPPVALTPAADRPARPETKPAEVKRAVAPAPEPPPPAPPKETPPDLAGMFEEARSAVIKGEYSTAIAKLETILKYDANYTAASNLLDVAKGGARNAAQLAVDSGNKAELTGDYATAKKQYERAQQLDPGSAAATDAMRRLKQRMQSEGEDVFRRAKVYDAMGRRPDAISLYEKALELLPPDHPSAKQARDSLASLKGGG